MSWTKEQFLSWAKYVSTSTPAEREVLDTAIRQVAVFDKEASRLLSNLSDANDALGKYLKSRLK